MSPSAERLPFHTSELLRCLHPLALAQAPLAGDALARRLGASVDFKAAIQLHALHAATLSPADPRHAASTLRAARQAVARVRQTLEHKLAQHGDRARALAQAELRSPAGAEAAVLCRPYRQCHIAVQRAADQALPPLRQRVRGYLAQGSERHHRLAALDAALEETLRAHESRLLAGLPAQLASALERSAPGAPADTDAQTDATAATEGAAPRDWAAWLTRLDAHYRTVLHAELDWRLQPTLGLLEALAESESESTA